MVQTLRISLSYSTLMLSDTNQKIFILSGVIVASDKFIDKDYLEMIRRRIDMTKLGQLYEKEKIEYGNERSRIISRGIPRDFLNLNHNPGNIVFLF